ncbi:MAG: acyl carrier protein [Lachnospiraceae bacterium]|nr:acyl carrier protein [Lachnospiraceae bacterium]
MSRLEVFEKLQEIFADVFDDDTIELTDETNSNDIEDWDSLEQINLIVAIETEFSIKFQMGEVSKIKNVGEMADLILERI